MSIGAISSSVLPLTQISTKAATSSTEEANESPADKAKELQAGSDQTSVTANSSSVNILA